MKKTDQLDQQFESSFGHLPNNDPTRKVAKGIVKTTRAADKLMADYAKLRSLAATSDAK